MKLKRNLGIWLDHSNAHLMEINTKKDKRTIKSNFSSEIKEEALNRSEDIMHNKEQQMHEAYYKHIGKAILNYDHVLLFGPTKAKVELHNYLRKDCHYEDIIIDTIPADNMTLNELHAFVDNHFFYYKYQRQS
ncbi:MAG: stalled ribosome rescue protein Dom34 [Saprospiraceae bacterium]|jgi:stalled ribosome rescue protein Dom34|tara:strand:+ start:342 stop:740 length:399 start_codon:yes stop_codon:yes gene_type:complete